MSLFLAQKQSKAENLACALVIGTWLCPIWLLVAVVTS
jgi:hypothetical protein